MWLQHMYSSTYVLMYSYTVLVLWISFGSCQDNHMETVGDVVGGNVTIRCDEGVTKYKFISLEVKYSENGESIRILTVDFRRETIKEHPSDTFIGRAFIYNIELNEPTFRLQNLTLTDQGIYQCMIIPPRGAVRTRYTNVNVITPPTSLKVFDGQGSPVPHTAGPFNEGDTITLECQVTGGRPKPKIYWYENRRILKSTLESANESVLTKATITIGPLNRNHTLSSLHCEASNHETRRLKSKPIKLNINLKPNKLKLITDESPLIADRKYEIECLAYGATPPALITWSLNGLTLTNTDDYSLHDNSTAASTLTFTPKDTDGGKTLTCSAKSPKIQHEPLVVSRILTIHFGPKVSLSMSPNNTVNEGDTVSMTCKSTSNPPANEIAFFKRGIKVRSSENTLMIEKTDRTSAGMYSCVATNVVQDSQLKESRDGNSKAVYLYVRHAPRCQKTRTVVGAGRQETVNITCDVDAWPDVNTYSWQFNKSGNIINLSDKMATVKTSPVVAYTPQSDEDFGSLLCWAQNAVGRMTQPCVYAVVKAELPDRLENCTQVNATATSVRVSCVAGRDGGLPQRFIAQLFDTTRHVHVHNATASTPHFLFEDLTPGTMFFMQLFSRNDKGASEEEVLQVNTSSLPDIAGVGIPSLHVFPITSILGVLIGLVAALVLVAILITVVMRLKASPKNDETPRDPRRPQIPMQPTKHIDAASDAHGIPKKLRNANLYQAASHDKKNVAKKEQCSTFSC